MLVGQYYRRLQARGDQNPLLYSGMASFTYSSPKRNYAQSRSDKAEADRTQRSASGISLLRLLRICGYPSVPSPASLWFCYLIVHQVGAMMFHDRIGTAPGHRLEHGNTALWRWEYYLTRKLISHPATPSVVTFGESSSDCYIAYGPAPTAQLRTTIERWPFGSETSSTANT